MEKNFENLLSKVELIYVHQSKFSEEDWHSTPHTHYFTEIMYILSGKGSFIVDNQEYPLKAHDVVIANPYVSHTEKSSEGSPLWYMVIAFNNIKFSKKSQKSVLG